MATNDLFIVESEDVAPVSEYEREGRINGELADLDAALSEEYPVQYKEFNTYYDDDA